MQPNIKNIHLIIILLVLTGCSGNKQSGDELITVDVTANYPKKELILQDFMDVEYIPLETMDDFINQGFVMDISKNFILVKNRNRDGDIFVYNKTGKVLRKINRKGQGGEEYTFITHIIMDEDNDEMYVHDHHGKKIQVYDLYGKFKRSLQYRENANGWFYSDIENFDKSNLICFDELNNFQEPDKRRGFVLISKQDGHITKKIEIPVKETKVLMQILADEANNVVYSTRPDPYRTIIPFNNNKILLELSSDTICTFSPDYNLRPLIVRTPPVQSMDTEVMLVLRLLSDRYYFMETIRNEYDWDTKKGFSKTYLMYDRQEKALSGYTVYNGDYSIKKEIYMSLLKPVNYNAELCQSLDAYRLVESYEKGELKDDKLKEIAATLDEDSNPVIMLIKHKK